MATFTYTYTIANGQKADAVPVQQNLNDARTFMLGSCWHKDGTNGFSQDAVVSQNTKSVLLASGGQYTYVWDTITLNAFTIARSQANLSLFKCYSTGFYVATIDHYALNTTETTQNSAYYGFSNQTTGVNYFAFLNASNDSAAGASWLVYLTANDIFYFQTALLVDGYVENATASIIQVGR